MAMIPWGLPKLLISVPTNIKHWSILIAGGPWVFLTVKSIEKLLSVREDPRLRELSEKLRKSNEMYETARRVAETHKNEIKAIRKEIDDLVKSRKRDQEQMDRLVARLEALISQMRREAA
jgi:hypothetical protein